MRSAGGQVAASAVSPLPSLITRHAITARRLQHLPVVNRSANEVRGRQITTMAKKNAALTTNGHGKTDEAQPILHQRGQEIQAYGTLRDLPVGVSKEGRQQNVALLNQLLADTITLYSMYKKHHWQVMGPTFYQLHLLFDKHATEQLALVDLIAER